jgi:hypothetical protein
LFAHDLVGKPVSTFRDHAGIPPDIAASRHVVTAEPWIKDYGTGDRISARPILATLSGGGSRRFRIFTTHSFSANSSVNCAFPWVCGQFDSLSPQWRPDESTRHGVTAKFRGAEERISPIPKRRIDTPATARVANLK